MDFGITFSRNFVDARDGRKSRKNPRKAQPLMNLHNNEVGRKVSEATTSQGVLLCVPNTLSLSVTRQTPNHSFYSRVFFFPDRCLAWDLVIKCIAAMPIVYSLKYLPSILHRLILKNNGVFFYPMHLIEPQSAPLNDRFVEDSVTFT